MKWRFLLFFGLLCVTGICTACRSGERSDSGTVVVREHGEGDSRTSIFVFPLREDIMPAAVRHTSRALREAQELDADYIIIDMNTYGGLLDAADSIRTMILEYPKPVVVFVNNQAASAGALISLAADSIYMRPGASIGAATVVDQQGAVMPDKYQSFMRSMMRATAEAHGRRTVIRNGDTLTVWRRDPNIAEAMVDPSVVVSGLVDDTKVVTFTADEAVRWGFAEGKASDVGDVIQQLGVDSFVLYEFRPTPMDKIIGFLTNPTVRLLFIMMIVGGLYFELQTPGIGFPLAVAVLGVVLYFAPLYAEGLVANWALWLFIAGVVMLVLEIFVTPGFGVLGVAGILAVVTGLAVAVVDKDLLQYIPSGQISISVVLIPLLYVVVAMGVALILSVWLGKRLLTQNSFFQRHVVLADDMAPDAGYISVEAHDNLVGAVGVAHTPLRPAGKVLINGHFYDAAGDNAAFIDRGATVTVVRDEAGVLYCRIVDSASDYNF